MVLTREHYVVVMAEESYGLRSLVNDLLFRLEESGRLAEMRRRWLEETYAYPRRAAAEGLPFSAEDMPQHYDQGRCQAAARFSGKSRVRLKQTALLPRNPKNEPDPYEAAALRRLAAQPSPPKTISELTDEGKTLRVLNPIYHTKDCLKCHGGPTGELDISGYPKEGAREGDLAGAISVSIPLEGARRGE